MGKYLPQKGKGHQITCLRTLVFSFFSANTVPYQPQADKINSIYYNAPVPCSVKRGFTAAPNDENPGQLAQCNGHCTLQFGRLVDKLGFMDP